MLKLAIEKAGGVDDSKKLNEAIQSITGYPASFGQASFTLSFAPPSTSVRMACAACR